MIFARRAFQNSRYGFGVALLLCCTISLFVACAKKIPEPEGYFSNYKGPQIAVTPTVIRLGVSALLKTQLVIGGKGFQPSDTVFIDLLGVGKDDPFKIPMGSTAVGGNGDFLLVVEDAAKLEGILRMDMDAADGKPVVVRDPIPVGKYVLKAISVNSDRKAECMLQVDPPGKMDRLKDKFAVWFGKIRIRR